MIAHDRTRLIGPLCLFTTNYPNKMQTAVYQARRDLMGR